MKFPIDIPVYGDKEMRGKCPAESAEQVTFFSWIRRVYPDSYGLIALHPRNEGARHYSQVWKEKSEGMTNGAADIIIPGSPAFVCELKRQDHTQSTWQGGQVDYLLTCKKAGAFVCIALGWEAAREAFLEWTRQGN